MSAAVTLRVEADEQTVQPRTRKQPMPRVASYEAADAPPRAECPKARPCTRVCRLRLDSPAASCALDVAERGGVTLGEIGDHLGVTRERVRQIEARALSKLTRAVRLGVVAVEGADERIKSLQQEQ